MAEVEIEKVVLSCRGIDSELDKSARLLQVISGMKAIKTKSRKRIPSFGVRPGLEIGCKVTLRGEKAEDILKNLLGAIENKLKEKQVEDECFSFGIHEYIEIPGMEYQREIGMKGLNVTVVFSRKGRRVERRKIKRGKMPKKQHVTKEEIIRFMETKFKTEIERKKTRVEEQEEQ